MGQALAGEISSGRNPVTSWWVNRWFGCICSCCAGSNRLVEEVDQPEVKGVWTWVEDG